jgi:acetylornithine deacetylase/succinyl-diaminopimelate desuccinylase-like protein
MGQLVVDGTADERIQVDALEFGAEVVYRILRRRLG